MLRTKLLRCRRTDARKRRFRPNPHFAANESANTRFPDLSPALGQASRQAATSGDEPLFGPSPPSPGRTVSRLKIRAVDAWIHTEQRGCMF